MLRWIAEGSKPADHQIDAVTTWWRYPKWSEVIWRFVLTLNNDSREVVLSGTREDKGQTWRSRDRDILYPEAKSFKKEKFSEWMLPQATNPTLAFIFGSRSIYSLNKKIKQNVKSYFNKMFRYNNLYDYEGTLWDLFSFLMRLDYLFFHIYFIIYS